MCNQHLKTCFIYRDGMPNQCIEEIDIACNQIKTWLIVPSYQKTVVIFLLAHV